MTGNNVLTLTAPVYIGDVLITGLIDRCTNNRVSVSIPMGPSVAEATLGAGPRRARGFRVRLRPSHYVRVVCTRSF